MVAWALMDHEEQVFHVIFLAGGGKEDVGARLRMSIRLMFIKLNRISTAFLSREGKSSKRRVAAKNWEWR